MRSLPVFFIIFSLIIGDIDFLINPARARRHFVQVALCVWLQNNARRGPRYRVIIASQQKIITYRANY